jgi:UDP-N-acetylglucosamine 4-epimerase
MGKLAVNWLDDPRHSDLRSALSAPRRWLVTGAAGFIGSNLVETLLAEGQHVRGLDNFATGRRSNLKDVQRRVTPGQWARFELIEGDICDLALCKSAVQGTDVVLHQAALGSVPRSVNDPLSSFRANVDGFANIVEAVRLCGRPVLVYASSSSIYGSEPSLPKIEHRTGAPLSPYAATKQIDEVMAEAYWQTFKLPSVGLRYFNVFGRRQDPDGAYAAVIPKWVAAMITGDTVEIYGDGETSRDFCFIDNTVQANLRAALVNFGSGHEVYNVALGERTTLNDLLRAIGQSLDARGFGRAQTAVHKDFRPGDVRHSLADVSRIIGEIGFVPQIRLSEGIERTLDYYIEEVRRAEARLSSPPVRQTS